MWKNKLKEMIYILEQSDVNEIEATFWGRKYRVVKNPGSFHSTTTPATTVNTAPVNSPDADSASAVDSVIENGVEVKSPMPGTFYCAPNPESEPYVQIGDRVEKGDSLCIVEAMKIMNEIETSIGGTVKKVLVENGKPVEFNQPLFLIE
ncbi:MAG: acetyl-CoA carboxylase biotin carboxyl carrier protein [Candidatus Neomarinimicrobiota bacterium]